MDLHQAVKEVADQFEYKSDGSVDDWTLLTPDEQGKLRGDCEDFSLTVIRKYCGSPIRYLFLFILFPRYSVWFCKSASGGGHVVGYADGLWFDNWTLKPLPKSEFFSKTGHKLRFPMVGPVLWVKLLVGKLL